MSDKLYLVFKFLRHNVNLQTTAKNQFQHIFSDKT